MPVELAVTLDLDDVWAQIHVCDLIHVRVESSMGMVTALLLWIRVNPGLHHIAGDRPTSPGLQADWWGEITGD